MKNVFQSFNDLIHYEYLSRNKSTDIGPRLKKHHSIWSSVARINRTNLSLTIRLHGCSSGLRSRLITDAAPKCSVFESYTV